MPRARKAKLSDEFRMEMALKYHVIDAQISNADGVTRVKHETFGWMPIERLYLLQKVHDLMPLVQEFVHGGYRAKQALWSINAEVLGVSLPLGAMLPVAEAYNLSLELLRRPIDPQALLVRLYALVGPWGDVIQIIDSLAAAGNLIPAQFKPEAWEALYRAVHPGPGPINF